MERVAPDLGSDSSVGWLGETGKLARRAEAEIELAGAKEGSPRSERKES
jgi:hypothetical protein